MIRVGEFGVMPHGERTRLAGEATSLARTVGLEHWQFGPFEDAIGLWLDEAEKRIRGNYTPDYLVEAGRQDGEDCLVVSIIEWDSGSFWEPPTSYDLEVAQCSPDAVSLVIAVVADLATRLAQVRAEAESERQMVNELLSH